MRLARVKHKEEEEVASSALENTNRQVRGVLCVVDADSRDRDAGRHLHGREQRIEQADR